MRSEVAAAHSSCPHRVWFFPVQVNGFVPVSLEAPFIARHIGAQLLIASESCVGAQCYLLLHVCLHAIFFERRIVSHMCVCRKIGQASVSTPELLPGVLDRNSCGVASGSYKFQRTEAWQRTWSVRSPLFNS